MPVLYKPSYDLKEAAAALGISPRSVRRLTETKELPSFMPSGIKVRLITGAAIEAYLARQEAAAQAAVQPLAAD